MYLDAQVDLFAFYVPHRHIYGSNWIDFIKQGVNETVTLGTRTLTSSVYCCGTHLSAGTVPKWIPEGYLNIWNRYFKFQTDPDFASSYFDSQSEGNTGSYYGLSCGHLPRIWNTPVTALTVAGDRRISLVDTNKIDLVELGEKQGSLESLRQSEFFARFYNNVLGNKFGSTVNTDADQRPTLLMHQSKWLSGYDVDVTDSVDAGNYSGKGATVGSLNVPWKFLPEHGAVWIMALLRFPPLHIKEVHYLTQKPEPTYEQISGDPAVYRNKGPVTLNVSEYIKTATVTDAGQIPFGQWYREQPHYVHNDYGAITGHPFLEEVISAADQQVKYISSSEYDNVFSTLQLKHWQSQGHCTVLVKRVVPDPRNSIFAGTV